MTTLYCAVCGDPFEPDDRHVLIEAEHRPQIERFNTDEFVMHEQCWDRLSGGWMEP